MLHADDSLKSCFRVVEVFTTTLARSGLPSVLESSVGNWDVLPDISGMHTEVRDTTVSVFYLGP